MTPVCYPFRKVATAHRESTLYRLVCRIPIIVIRFEDSHSRHSREEDHGEVLSSLQNSMWGGELVRLVQFFACANTVVAEMLLEAADEDS